MDCQFQSGSRSRCVHVISGHFSLDTARSARVCNRRLSWQPTRYPRCSDQPHCRARRPGWTLRSRDDVERTTPVSLIVDPVVKNLHLSRTDDIGPGIDVHTDLSVVDLRVAEHYSQLGATGFSVEPGTGKGDFDMVEQRAESAAVVDRDPIPIARSSWVGGASEDNRVALPVRRQ